MTITTPALIDLAREARSAASAMTPQQLDDWYEQNVGRRLLDETPDLDPRQHVAHVASMMFYHSCPEGLDTPGAEAMETRLEHAINKGQPL